VQASFHWLQESFPVAEALPGSAVAAWNPEFVLSAASFPASVTGDEKYIDRQVQGQDVSLT
jgi:hypothetical protein